MKRFTDVVAVIGFSVGALVFFYLPYPFASEDSNSILAYSLMSITFFYIIWTYRLPSLAYFRLPELSIASFLGIAVALFYGLGSVFSDRAITLPFWSTISGIFFIFAIGAGEELVSRGLAFGILRKYGTTTAVIGSSILFGVMHLNVYTGDAWDPYHAYWHCLTAASFGALAAVLMIVTRSIIVPIVMHALFDWTVVFSKDEVIDNSGELLQFDPLWQTIKDSVDYIGFDLSMIFFLLFIFWLTQNRKFPKFLQPVLVKFGLLERTESTRARARKYLNPIRARSR